MAEPASDYHRGEMDIQEQVSTYELVMNLTKWGSLAISAFILLITIWFCTSGGFLSGLAAAFVLTAAGFLMLRDKKSAH